MQAIRERVTEGQSETLVWHKPVGRVQEEFQAIACSTDEGIVYPPTKQDVPLNLDKPGERWCRDCLAVIRADRTTAK